MRQQLLRTMLCGVLAAGGLTCFAGRAEAGKHTTVIVPAQAYAVPAPYVVPVVAYRPVLVAAQVVTPAAYQPAYYVPVAAPAYYVVQPAPVSAATPTVVTERTNLGLFGYRHYRATVQNPYGPSYQVHTKQGWGSTRVNGVLVP
jgi:hypothetical protein